MVEGRVVRAELTKDLCTCDMAYALMRHTMVKTMSSTHLSVRVIVPHSESENIWVLLYTLDKLKGSVESPAYRPTQLP
jgi:hypothetical protein